MRSGKDSVHPRFEASTLERPWKESGKRREQIIAGIGGVLSDSIQERAIAVFDYQQSAAKVISRMACQGARGGIEEPRVVLTIPQVGLR